jgi:glycosyltransferase involved in cell wall biosynthesis
MEKISDLSNTIKCIFVCNEILPRPWGGIGSYTVNLASALHKLGIQVFVAGLYEKDYESVYPFQVINIKPRNIKIGERFGVQNLLNRIQLYNKIIKLTKIPGRWVVEWPDYIGLWLKSNPYAIEVNKIHGAFFLQPHPGFPTWDTFWEGRQLQRLGNWSSVSDYYGSWVAERLYLTSHPIFTSYIPIDTDIFKPTISTEIVKPQIIFCGNANLRKRPETLIAAFIYLADKYVDLSLVFVGNVFFREENLRNLLPSSLQHRVRFTGLLPAPKVAELLNQSTVMCMPSEHESFGIAWVEAMACEVPVVAGRNTCAEEIVTSQAGIFVDPLSPHETAKAIDGLLSNPSKRKKMGQAGRCIVEERYASPIVAQRVLDWYTSLWERKIHDSLH